MRVRFTWQTEEWHEAVRLVTDPPRLRRDFPYMVYGVLGLTCLGGIGDLFHFLQARQIENAGGIFLGVACTAVAGSGMVWLTRTGLRKRHARRLPPAPPGEQQATFQENGWSAGAYTADKSLPLQPWAALECARTGTKSIVMLGSAGTFTAVPLRALSVDETGHLQRLLARKLRPSLQTDLVPASAPAGI